MLLFLVGEDSFYSIYECLYATFVITYVAQPLTAGVYCVAFSKILLPRFSWLGLGHWLVVYWVNDLFLDEVDEESSASVGLIHWCLKAINEAALRSLALPRPLAPVFSEYRVATLWQNLPQLCDGEGGAELIPSGRPHNVTCRYGSLTTKHLVPPEQALLGHAQLLQLPAEFERGYLLFDRHIHRIILFTNKIEATTENGNRRIQEKLKVRKER